MASNDTKSLNGDDPPEPSSLDPPMALGYSMHMYPFPTQILPQQQPPRSKRRQVKNACTNCQKACKKCDDARPCLRCVKYGVSEECINSQRKERKKGIKRGPYKKRDGRGSNVERPDVSSQDAVVSNSGPTHLTGSPPLVGPPLVPFPGYYGQYPPYLIKPAENGHLYPQYVPLPQPPIHGTSEADHGVYPTHQYFPAFVPYGPPPVYSVPRHDGQVPTNYMLFPLYPKAGSPSELGSNRQAPDEEDRTSGNTSDKAG